MPNQQPGFLLRNSHALVHVNNSRWTRHNNRRFRRLMNYDTSTANCTHFLPSVPQKGAVPTHEPRPTGIPYKVTRTDYLHSEEERSWGKLYVLPWRTRRANWTTKNPEVGKAREGVVLYTSISPSLLGGFSGKIEQVPSQIAPCVCCSFAENIMQILFSWVSEFGYCSIFLREDVIGQLYLHEKTFPLAF